MQELSPDELNKYIPLTSTNPNEIQMPGVGAEASEAIKELMTTGIEKALVADELKNVLMRETQELKLPAYLLDLTNIELPDEGLRAIRGLLPGGNTALYLKTGNSYILVGSGDDYVLYTVLEDVLMAMLGDKCKLSKNNGSGFKALGKNDVSSVRLNL